MVRMSVSMWLFGEFGSAESVPLSPNLICYSISIERSLGCFLFKRTCIKNWLIWWISFDQNGINILTFWPELLTFFAIKIIASILRTLLVISVILLWTLFNIHIEYGIFVCRFRQSRFYPYLNFVASKFLGQIFLRFCDINICLVQKTFYKVFTLDQICRLTCFHVAWFL